MANQSNANTRLVNRLLLVVVAMFGFGFALVPLYDVFCDLTGLNGRSVQRVDALAQSLVDDSRVIKIEFVTFDKTGKQMTFRPQAQYLQVHPGEMKEVTFTINNPLSHLQIVQAIPSVSPGQASLYLNKAECFCFNQQSLEPERVSEFKLKFFIDKDLPKNIEVLTLAYTLYPIEQPVVAQVLRR
ncbi:cytochrome c oxidase assembly protein [Catenovulum sp. 2E275]|uniref:cytochrome c oxidase assembly protein n=1 Tax=Catenovulum sp. 2E275 TaxID=2980497 RepID=UPI0021D35488|nr:cytochrome c oxidase assembly protein [Catenovulum sp. 2E275]MCU4674434.1 cytochrome c oxidase assembly protein [Catenovulum sp. 2E275]